MREDVVYVDTCELAYNMYMQSHNLRGATTELIASYEICSEVLKDLMTFEDTTAFNIELNNPEINEYYDEYILTVDDEQNVWIEPFRCKDGGYLAIDDELVTLVYVHNDVNSKAILEIDEAVIQAFEFEWDNVAID